MPPSISGAASQQELQQSSTDDDVSSSSLPATGAAAAPFMENTCHKLMQELQSMLNDLTKRSSKDVKLPPDICTVPAAPALPAVDLIQALQKIADSQAA